MSDERSGVPSPLGLVLYLVYQDVGATTEWLVNTLGFIESGGSVDANGVVRNAELKAGPTVLMLERNDHQPRVVSEREPLDRSLGRRP